MPKHKPNQRQRRRRREQQCKLAKRSNCCTQCEEQHDICNGELYATTTTQPHDHYTTTTTARPLRDREYELENGAEDVEVVCSIQQQQRQMQTPQPTFAKTKCDGPAATKCCWSDRLNQNDHHNGMHYTTTTRHDENFKLDEEIRDAVMKESLREEEWLGLDSTSESTHVANEQHSQNCQVHKASRQAAAQWRTRRHMRSTQPQHMLDVHHDANACMINTTIAPHTTSHNARAPKLGILPSGGSPPLGSSSSPLKSLGSGGQLFHPPVNGGGGDPRTGSPDYDCYTSANGTY